MKIPNQLFKLLLIILNAFLELPMLTFVFEIEEIGREPLEFFFSLRKGCCVRSCFLTRSSITSSHQKLFPFRRVSSSQTMAARHPVTM